MCDNETKMNKETVMEQAAARINALPAEAGVPPVSDEALRAYFDVIQDVIVEGVMSGAKVCFTGFGSFYLKLHKGHPVQFGGRTGRVKDYMTFRFSPSNVLSKSLRSLGVPRQAASAR